MAALVERPIYGAAGGEHLIQNARRYDSIQDVKLTRLYQICNIPPLCNVARRRTGKTIGERYRQGRGVSTFSVVGPGELTSGCQSKIIAAEYIVKVKDMAQV
jgi:hypothetical protein